MKRKLFFLLCATICITWGVKVSAVNGTGPAQEAPASQQEKIFLSITPQEAMRMLQTREDLIFLDVRTPRERSYGAIPGSQLVSFYDLVNGKVPLPKEKPVMLVCAVGGRSYVAGQVLSKKGHMEVYNVSGGIKGWYKAGLPIVQDPAYSTQPAR